MPKVGIGKSAKHFAYTPTGVQKATAEAVKTGKPVVNVQKPRKPKK